MGKYLAIQLCMMHPRQKTWDGVVDCQKEVKKTKFVCTSRVRWCSVSVNRGSGFPGCGEMCSSSPEGHAEAGRRAGGRQGNGVSRPLVDRGDPQGLKQRAALSFPTYK